MGQFVEISPYNWELAVEMQTYMEKKIVLLRLVILIVIPAPVNPEIQVTSTVVLHVVQWASVVS